MAPFIVIVTMTSLDVSGSALPSGVTLSTSGALSGTPTVSGTFNFRVRATDANLCGDSIAYALVVTCPAIAVNPNYPEVYANRASIKAQRFDLDGAIADLAKALEVAPVDWGSRKDAEAMLAQLKKLKGS